MSDDRAELILKTGGRLTLDRGRGLARYAVPRRLSVEELVHPFLAPAAAVVAHWTRKLSFHAGAFVSDGGAWGLVGDREAGKSSTLAWLALNGHDIVADDVLVLMGGSAYAGPRSVDLRRDSAERLEIGTALGVIGSRPRWRMGLPPIQSKLPFGGWIFLEWGDRFQSRRLASSECLTRLMANLTLRIPAADPAYLLELATLPSWELQRPRDWRHLARTGEWLLSAAR